MWDWMMAPIDASRVHELTSLQAWHARTMFFAWGALAPMAILIARYCKVLPNQNWPVELDNQFWWRCHWIGQTTVFVLSLVAATLIYSASSGPLSVHGIIGYTIIALSIVQVTMGRFRGSKGGPTDPQPDGSLHGDHYSMTAWRHCFEWTHKVLGYFTLLLSASAVVIGLWNVNAPRWMWVLIIAWWCFLIVAFIVLQRLKLAFDTYQAIWGPHPSHPGNAKPRPAWNWGMHRYNENPADNLSHQQNDKESSYF